MIDPKSAFNENLDRVYTFICEFISDNEGLSPTLREIADGCFITRSNVTRYLDKLEGQGRIRREPGLPRSIRLVGK